MLLFRLRSGLLATRVNRQCPVARTVCSVLNLDDNSIASSNYCKTVQVGSSLLCRCGEDIGNGNTSAAILALGGKIAVGAVRTYTAGESVVSVVSNSLSVSSIAEKSVLIFVSFGILWGMGIIVMLTSVGVFTDFRRYTIDQAPLQTLNRIATHILTIKAKNKVKQKDSESNLVLEEYLRHILPEYYTCPRIFALLSVLTQRHQYFRIMLHLLRSEGISRQDPCDKKLIFDTMHVITAITLSCFMLALLYDFQYPVDDGYCGLQQNEKNCLFSKTLFDPFQSKCTWIPPPTIMEGAVIVESLHGKSVNVIRLNSVNGQPEDDNSTVYCFLNEDNNSLIGFLVSYVITSIFAKVANFLIDFMLSILNARDKSEDDRQTLDGIDGRSTVFDLEFPTAHVELFRKKHFIKFSNVDLFCESRSRLVSERLTSVPTNKDYCFTGSDSANSTEKVSALAAVATTTLFSFGHTTDVAVAILREGLADCFVVANVDISRKSVYGAIVNHQSSNNSVHEIEQGEYEPIAASYCNHGQCEMHSSGFKVEQELQSIQRQVFVLSLQHAFQTIQYRANVALLRYVVCFALLAINGCALYFIIAKAAIRGVKWQISFLKISIWEWFSEVVILQGLEILLFDYWLCILVFEPVRKSINMLEKAALDGTRNKIEDGDCSTIAADFAKRSSLVSMQLAQLFPVLAESKWVTQVLLSLSQNQKADPVDVCMHDEKQRYQYWLMGLLVEHSIEFWEQCASIAATFFLAFLIYMYYLFIDPILLKLPVYIIVTMFMSVFGAIGIILAVQYCRYRQRHVQPDEESEDMADTSEPICVDTMNHNDDRLDERRYEDTERDDSFVWSSDSSSSSSEENESSSLSGFSSLGDENNMMHRKDIGRVDVSVSDIVCNAEQCIIPYHDTSSAYSISSLSINNAPHHYGGVSVDSACTNISFSTSPSKNHDGGTTLHTTLHFQSADQGTYHADEHSSRAYVFDRGLAECKVSFEGKVDDGNDYNDRKGEDDTARRDDEEWCLSESSSSLTLASSQCRHSVK